MGLPAIPQDFIAHWPGSISGGQLIDETGSYPGTVNGSVTRAIGRVGEAADYSGTGYVDISGAVSGYGSDPSELTICTFTDEGDAPAKMLFSHRSSSSDLLQLYRTAAGTVKAQIRTSGAALSEHIVTFSGQAHIALVYQKSAASCQVVVNGLLVHTFTGMSGTLFSTKAFLGAYDAGGGIVTASGGLMTNRTKIYPRALSIEELKACALERPAIPTTNLVAAYDFADMADGVVPDSAPGADGAYDASVVGSTPKRGMMNGVGVDAVGANYLQAAAPSTTAGITLSVRVRFSASGVPQFFISRRDGGGANDWQFDFTSANQIRVLLWGLSVISITASFTPSAGQEAHVAATWDGATVRLYLDGSEVAVQASTGSLSNSASSVRLGHDWYSGGSSVGLSGVRIYNAALSASDIALLATERPRVPTLGLVSRWTMGNIDGSTLVDEMDASNGAITDVTFQAGQVGNEAVFNGSTSSVVLGNVLGSLANCSISAFGMRTTTGITNLYTFADTTQTQQYLQLYLKSDGVYLDLARGGGSSNNLIRFYATVSQNARYHVVFEALNGEYRCALNGVDLGSPTVSAGIDDGAWGDTLTGGAKKDDFGALWSSGGPYYTAGVLDQVSAFSLPSGLEPLDILALANESLPYFVSGQVKEDGSPVIRTVRAYRDDDGTLLGSAQSDANGDYRIDLDTGQQVLVMALGGTGYRPRVHGPVDPTESV